jgi:hypothetical protein
MKDERSVYNAVLVGKLLSKATKECGVNIDGY